MQWLHNNNDMPTIHRLANLTIRVNAPDHLPPHVHVVMKDRRDALVMIDGLQVISRTLKAADIAEALDWIADNRAFAKQVFKECNP